MAGGWPYNTRTWKRLRGLHLSAHPLCDGCERMGRVTIADTVDHRTPIRMGGGAFDPANLVSYCTPCHSAKTARGAEAGAVKTTRPRKGCNPDGTPLDPDHPWAKNRSGLRREHRPPPFAVN